MIIKLILFAAGIISLLVLFLFQNALTKPIYNKMSNMWQDDTQGRTLANYIVWFMTLIGFLLGLYI
jgi:hypothetical protein